jgi:UbiD family decarboxylase
LDNHPGTYIHILENQKKLIRVIEPISKKLEIEGILKQCEPTPVLFENVREASFPVIGNLFCSKAAFADYFGIRVTKIIQFLLSAIQNRTPSKVVTNAACQEVVHDEPDLDLLPIMFHCGLDGGNYISSGVVLASHPVYGQNADFHRCMQFSKTEMSVRVVRNRHFDRYLRDQGIRAVFFSVTSPRLARWRQFCTACIRPLISWTIDAVSLPAAAIFSARISAC